MKRQYWHSGSRKNSSSLRFIGWGIIIFIFLVFVGMRFFLPNIFFALVSPLFVEGTSLSHSGGNFFTSFTNKEKLVQENENINKENLALKNENAVLTTRAQDLTQLLGGAASTGLSPSSELLAGVLARPPESPYDTLTIAAGSADGVLIGASAFAQGGIPIGTIKHVEQHTAQVSLYSTSNRDTDGWVGQSRTPLTIVGQGAGSFMATVPVAATVAVGDSVYVPGPGALPIGTVSRIDSDPSSPTEVLRIQPLTNLFTITWVEVSRTAS